MAKIQDIYKVVSNERLCPQFYCLCIDAKPILKKVLPGQFIHIRVNDQLYPFSGGRSVFTAPRNI